MKHTLAIWTRSTGEDKVNVFMAFHLKSGLIILAFVALGWASFCVGQTAQPTPVPNPEHGPEQRETASDGQQLSDRQLPGSITGTIVDQSGAVVAGARVRLTGKDQSLSQELRSGGNGQFSFANVAPGPSSSPSRWRVSRRKPSLEFCVRERPTLSRGSR